MTSLFLSKTIKLPLKVEFVSWNFASLVVSGHGWMLNIDSSWMVIKEDKLFCDEDDDAAESKLQVLLGLMLVAVIENSSHEVVPVKFLLQNGFCLHAWGEGEVYFGVK